MRYRVEYIAQELFRLQKANKDLTGKVCTLVVSGRQNANVKPRTRAQKAEANNLKGEEEQKP